MSNVRSRFAAPPYHQWSPASVRRFFAVEELRFNETRREKKLSSSLDACHLHGSLSVSFYLVESADQIYGVAGQKCHLVKRKSCVSAVTGCVFFNEGHKRYGLGRK